MREMICQFGLRYLFGLLWRPLFDIYDDHLSIKGRSYEWGQLNKLLVYDAGILRGPPTPVAKLYLDDGRVVKITVPYFSKDGRKPKLMFLSSVGDAFLEFAKLVEQKSGIKCDWQGVTGIGL